MKRRRVVTWQTPDGGRVSICRECERLFEEAGVWPKDWEGNEYATVYHGEHEGHCDTHAAIKVALALELRPTIEVLGAGGTDWTEGDDEWERYGTVLVRIGDVTYEVGAVIGVPEDLRDTARTARGDQITPYLDAWFADASDYTNAAGDDGSTGIDPRLYDDLRAALSAAAPRLWQEVRP